MLQKHKKLTAILGNITFLEMFHDGEDRAIIQNALLIKEFYNESGAFVEEFCENLIENRTYDSYIISELYSYPIEFADGSTKNLVIDAPVIKKAVDILNNSRYGKL